ncbi:cysteine protease StiP domain-containing protein [Massilia jejuensis]|uniref:Cysteine protease StiP domain-containing protein n=1 Tax=Massilia jejuensis TaxID=648894 RepID=A0ABW0PMJ8_9BURK
MIFAGSYLDTDVHFLLKRLPLADFVDVREKEALIQSGRRHYSEMLSPERPPSARYLALFDEACRVNGARMARDCLRLAGLIAQRRAGPVTLVSLARGGTPVGVVLKRLLEKVHGRATAHYSVSIVRDRGIDANALRHILAQGHAPASLVFVDGWTGKGVIARELASSIDRFNADNGVTLDGGLHVLSDLAGAAAVAASCEDYLIPSSILNATVSGLVSRSVLNDAIGPDDFHGCVLYDALAAEDRSRSFVDLLERLALAQEGREAPLEAADTGAAGRSRAYIAAARQRYGIADVNLVKPGIGEATRVLLRRVPRLLLLRDPHDPATAHLRLLAEEKDVPVEIDPALPYQAVSLIRSALDA